jgi:hypothetical protein
MSATISRPNRQVRDRLHGGSTVKVQDVVHGPFRRFHRLIISVAIGGIADIGWPAAAWTRSQVTRNGHGASG